MVRRFESVEALSRAAADAVCRAGAAAVAARGRFAIALAGGDTPRRLHALLAAAPFRARVDWGRAEVFFGDERCVPPDAPGSNYRAAAEALLRPLGLAPERVHRIRGEAAPDAAAAEYERELARALGAAPGGPPPALDLVLLGLGADGHTASLFPGSAALDERARWAVAARGPPPLEDRVTLTLPVLDAAREVLFLVAGAAKAAALAAALDPAARPRPPAALVRPRAGRVAWYVDRAAAARLAAGEGEAPGTEEPWTSG